MSLSKLTVSSILLLAATGSLSSAAEIGDCAQLKGTVDLSKYKDVSFKGCKINDVVLSGIKDNAMVTFVGSDVQGKIALKNVGKGANVRFAPAEETETEPEPEPETDTDPNTDSGNDSDPETGNEKPGEGSPNDDSDKDFGGKPAFAAGSALTALVTAAALAL